MILQKIIFPQKDICEDTELYYRGIIEKNIIKEDVKFNTYFNSFSIEKWRKYTVLNNLSIVLNVSGKGKINVINTFLDNGITIKNEIKSIKIDEKKEKDVQITIDNLDLKGIIYFEIEPEKDFKFIYGKYITDTDKNKENDVNLAICICTYKREEFLKKNLRVLEDNIINNDKSQVSNNLDVFIIDNAQTLNEEDFKNERLHYFKNKNVGGSGGFTRGLIEAVFNSNKGITHCILMDDDIILDSNVIEKTYSFLKILKKEYDKKMIGGEMLYYKQKYMQGEAGAQWKNTKSIQRNHNFDLRDENLVLKNELDENNFNYNGWWYCCIPAKIVTKNNLPLPIFIHKDDIEYGVRNKDGFILLNGICVWHPDIVNKGPITVFYYNNRNMLILNARHQKLSKFKIKLSFFVFVVYNLAQYKYSEIELAFKGVNDYYLGIDNFKKIDGELMHKELSVYNHKKVESDSKIEKEQQNSKSIKILQVLRGILSYIVPQFAKDKVYTSNIAVNTSCFAKKMVIYDVESKKVFYLKRNYKKMLNCVKEYFKICKIINKKNEKITNEWNNRFEEITNLEFWKKYLDI